MAPKELEKESPSLKPHGDVVRMPDAGKAGSRPPGEPGTGVPPTPGEPTPSPDEPDAPGKLEPGEPDQGQPIPPELDTTKPRL